MATVTETSSFEVEQKLAVAAFVSPLVAPFNLLLWAIPDFVENGFPPVNLIFVTGLVIYIVTFCVIGLVGFPAYALFEKLKVRSLWAYLCIATLVWLIFTLALDLPSFVRSKHSEISIQDWFEWVSLSLFLLSTGLLCALTAYFISWPEKLPFRGKAAKGQA